MTLISNWRRVLFSSFSLWFVLASLVATAGLFFALIRPETLGWPPLWFAGISALLQVLAIPARVVMQRGISGLVRYRHETRGAVSTRALGMIAGSGLALSAAVAFVGDWEGLRTRAYQDVVGVWTICYGQTTGVTPDQHRSKAECDAMLARDIASYEAALDRCLKVDVPLGMKIALVSWTYNVGAGAACASTLMRKANAGDLAGACAELPRWNRAGGRVWRGLTNRRLSEQQMCLSAVAGQQ